MLATHEGDERMRTRAIGTACALGALSLWAPQCAAQAAAPPAQPAPPASAASAAVPAAPGEVPPTGGEVDSPGLQHVTITATRIATPAIDVPASIDRVALDPEADDRAGINISEALGTVPGLLARDRQNYAQDVQVSVRGFGARSTFGIRGVRLYVDGIPATMPDGQGQITNVDLNSATSIEVLRGPFSALYGNSSGGVLQVFTEDGAGAPRLSLGVGAGSYGQWRYDGKLTGASGPFSYVVSGSHFETDGYRDHSAAERSIGNAKLRLRFDEDSSLTLVANAVDLPRAQDPLGLTRAEYEADPRGVDPAAIQFDTRKTTSQNQLGATYERRLDAANTLSLMLYGGHRATEQFQAIPVAAQINPLSPGGVIQLGRDYAGTDVRWTWRAAVAQQPLSVVGGVALDDLNEHRLGYQNFVGTGPDQVLGVQGALRRDEINKVDDLDPYLQAEWHPAPDWTLDAGVRRSSVSFVSTDHYVTPTNPDDSGRVSYAATLPVIGAVWAPMPALRVYATAGRGFETPTLNELAYRPNGESGLNFDLRPSRSDNLEAGVKGQAGQLGEWSAAIFGIHTRDEIVTLSNVGGRATYQNVAATRRLGAELSWDTHVWSDLLVSAAYTWLDARYSEAFLTCTTTPCPAPNVPVAADSRIPGVARHVLDATLDWAPPHGWRAGVEGRYVSSVFVNDTNSDAAPGYIVASLHAGYAIELRGWSVSAFARVDNLFDKQYIGSVIVNEGNARYFEPAPGRNWFAGVTAAYRF
jgi:iron complex outermembrane receptor protein